MSSFFNLFFSSPFSLLFFPFSPIWSFHIHFSHMHYSLPTHVFKPLYRLSPSLCPFQHSFFAFQAAQLSFLPLAILGWPFPDARLSLGFRVSFWIWRFCHIHANPRIHGITWGQEGPQELPHSIPLPGQLSQGQYGVSPSWRGLMEKPHHFPTGTCFLITRCKAGVKMLHLPASSCKNEPRNARQVKLPTIASFA